MNGLSKDGRRLATLIPNSRFVTLASNNHIVFAGEPSWPIMRDTARRFMAEHEGLNGARTAFADFGELSEREREVLELIARGLVNDEIAHQLQISPRTVRNHITRVFAKVGASSRAQAIVRARDAGYGVHGGSSRVQ